MSRVQILNHSCLFQILSTPRIHNLVYWCIISRLALFFCLFLSTTPQFVGFGLCLKYAFNILLAMKMVKCGKFTGYNLHISNLHEFLSVS